MIGILGFNDLHLMQYLYKYTNILDEHGAEYDVVFWDRSERSEPVGFKGNAVAFEYSLNTYLPFWKKIGGFVKYARFMRKQIKEKKYDHLIILTTQTAIPLYDLLVGRYKGRFIYDYRDITREKQFFFFKKMVQKLIRCSYRTAMSSKGFLQEIGVEKTDRIIVAHNTQYACNKSEYSVKLEKQEPIRIVYWGMVRQLEHNKLVCDAFGKDSRFELIYHGDGYYEELRDYCRKKCYANVSFTGRYSTSSIPQFVETTDILNCLYENDEIQKCAMPVKAYDAIHYRLPVLITSGSYLAEYYNELYGAKAIEIKTVKNISDIVYSWYMSLVGKRIEESYQAMELQVFDDDLRFIKVVETIL